MKKGRKERKKEGEKEKEEGMYLGALIVEDLIHDDEDVHQRDRTCDPLLDLTIGGLIGRRGRAFKRQHAVLVEHDT